MPFIKKKRKKNLKFAAFIPLQKKKKKHQKKIIICEVFLNTFFKRGGHTALSGFVLSWTAFLRVLLA